MALALGGARGLVQTVQGVELAQDADDGVAGAVAAGEGGGHVGHLPLHGEAQLFHQLTVVVCGLVFQQGEFGQLPHLVGEGGDGLLMLVYDVVQFFLIHNDHSTFLKKS